MQGLKTANLALAFLLELAMLAAFGWRGLLLGGWVGWVVAVLAIVAAIALWAVFAAPRSPRRLRGSALLVFKIVMFGVAVAALAAGGATWWAVGFAVVAAINLALAWAWRQDEVAGG